MRGRDDLYHLIQGMTKTEKRYFVLDAKKSGRADSRYLSLFEALNDMEQFDEDQLKRSFTVNLSSDKAYLYDAILRSMRDYRSQSSSAARMKERLLDARYLFERGLYEQSHARILESKSLASALQDQFALLEINREEHISLFDRKTKVTLEQIEQLNSERQDCLNAVQEELTYLDLYYRLLLEVFREFNLRDAGSISALKKRLPLHLLEVERKPASPRALRRYYQCQATYHNLLGDTQQVFEHFLKIVEWWEQYPVLREEEFHRYVIDVSNLVNCGYENPDFLPEAQKWLDRLRQEGSGGSYHHQRIIFFKLSISNLLFLLNQNDFEKAKKMLPEIIAGMQKFGADKSLVLPGNVAIVYFLVEDYRNCIFWANHITRSLRSSGREDIRRLVRLLKLLSLFELGEVEELETAMRATRREFKAQELSADRFENKVLLLYFKRIFSSPLSEVKAAIIEFRDFLESVRSRGDHENPLGLDEFLIYANRKLKTSKR